MKVLKSALAILVLMATRPGNPSSVVVQNESSEPGLEPVELYRQGSEMCRQYSKLTMGVRTLSQQILIGYTVGVGVTLSKVEVADRGPILALSGGVLILFAAALWTLNRHHSTAFVEIRDEVLSVLEGPYDVQARPRGPWQAQRRAESWISA